MSSNIRTRSMFRSSLGETWQIVPKGSEIEVQSASGKVIERVSCGKRYIAVATEILTEDLYGVHPGTQDWNTAIRIAENAKYYA